MAIQRSAASEILALIDSLGDADPRVRDSAVIRLSVAGVRAVPHLIDAFAARTSPTARAAILRALEGSGDRRAVEAAIAVLHSSPLDPKVASAAVRLLGSHLESGESDRALDALSALALDPAYKQAIRLEALTELGRVSARVLAPIRKWLAADPDDAVRRAAAGESRDGTPPAADAVANLERVAEGQAADPAAFADWVRAAASDLSISTLHKLIEVARAQEARAPADADREEWMSARGAVHLTLAGRGSHVAIYDLRESLAKVPSRLSGGFVAAAAAVGDAACLEPIAAALAAEPADLETRDHGPRDALVAAGRAIVQRERLTRRHAVIRKLLKAWPETGPALL